MTTEQRFKNFVQELTTISRRHGIAVMSMGGVFILEDSEAMQHVAYTCDHTSGDLEFRLSQ